MALESLFFGGGLCSAAAAFPAAMRHKTQLQVQRRLVSITALQD